MTNQVGRNSGTKWLLSLSGALLALGIAACGSDKTTEPPVAPQLLSASPADGATGVVLNTRVSAVFDMAMTPLTTADFTLKNGTTAVPGSISTSTDGMTATFLPSANLLPSTVYTATITSGASSLAGGAFAANRSWSFTTGTTADTTQPLVVSTAPIDGATSVPRNSKVTVTFSRSMDPASFTSTSFSVKQGTTAVAGNILCSGGVVTFTPGGPLAASLVYTAGLTTAVKDMLGNTLAVPFTWTFTTGATTDTSAPLVTSTLPADLATGVPTNTKVAATFSKMMDPMSFMAGSFTVKQGTTPVAGTVASSGNTATFTPGGPLATGMLYTASVANTVKDMMGNMMASPHTWTFTTGSTNSLGPAPVLLGSSGNYVILAKTGVSSLPASLITGDIGLSPTAATGLTGFNLIADASNVFSTSAQVTGKLYAADYAPPTPTILTTAIGDMQTAYVDAAGRVNPDHLELGTGEIGGMTLAPGLYKWTSTVTISNDVTLNGGANDVWIFQTSQDLSMSSAKSIILAGGAQAKNVFWQVAGAASVGTTAHFEGVILCMTKIDIFTGASINGKMLSQTAVNLQAATVVQVAP